MIEGFDQYAHEYDAWFLENPNVLESETRLVAKALRGGGNILSVGCGSGLFEMIMANSFGITITDGVEPSSSMAAIARKRGMNVTEATAEEYDYPQGVYDTILFNGCPSYITDLKKVIEKVYASSVPVDELCLSMYQKKALMVLCTTSPRVSAHGGIRCLRVHILPIHTR